MHYEQSALVSELECQRLFLAFIQCLDERDAAGAVAVVAPDVIWYRQGEKLVGPDAIKGVIDARPPDRAIRHHLNNVVVTLDGPDKATSRAYYCVYLHEGSQRPRVIRGPERVGDYFAEYRRTAQGWRICALRAQRIFSVAVGE